MTLSRVLITPSCFAFSHKERAVLEKSLNHDFIHFMTTQLPGTGSFVFIAPSSSSCSLASPPSPLSCSSPPSLSSLGFLTELFSITPLRLILNTDHSLTAPAQDEGPSCFHAAEDSCLNVYANNCSLFFACPSTSTVANFSACSNAAGH